LDRTTTSDPQRTDRFNRADSRLRRPVGLPRQRGPGGRDGVDGVRLALGSSGFAVGPVDLDELHTLAGQVAGQAGAVGSGALDTDFDQRAVRAQPRQQRPVTRRSGRELLIAEHTPGLVDRSGVVGVAVGVDATCDLLLLSCHAGLVVPFAWTEQG
jgi:hypothetical protein